MEWNIFHIYNQLTFEWSNSLVSWICDITSYSFELSKEKDKSKFSSKMRTMNKLYEVCLLAPTSSDYVALLYYCKIYEIEPSFTNNKWCRHFEHFPWQWAISTLKTKVTLKIKRNLNCLYCNNKSFHKQIKTINKDLCSHTFPSY